MRKHGILIVLFAGIWGVASAQQASPRTQFYQNRLAYNPAVAGSDKEIPITMNFREQWMGIDYAPSTQTLSSHAFAGRNVGLGLVIANDVAGPSRNTGFQAAMSRHFAIDREGKRFFSFGMSLLLYQFRFDVDQLKTDIPNDPAVAALAKQNSRMTPDMGAGIYLSDERGYAGISCLNMIQTKSDIFNVENSANTIKRIYYLLAGYRFPVNHEFSIEPLGLLKMTEAFSWQADIMVKAYYNNYWAGLAYRTDDAAAALLGLRLDMFSFSYSYDYPVSKIGSFNSGTHEVTASVFIFNATSRYGPLKKDERKKSRYKSPSRRRRW